MALLRPSRRTAVVGAVVALDVILAAATSLLWHVPVVHGPAVRLDGWLLAVMFAVTEAVVLHVQVRRETQAISLSEIPLVLGLLFAAPVPLLVARLSGSLLVSLTYRRQPWVKVLFNLSMQAAEVSAALAVFSLLVEDREGVPLRSVVAVYAAVLAAAVVAGWSLRTVIDLSEGALSWHGYVDELVEYPPVAAATATLGVVSAYCLRDGPAASWALLTTLAGLLAGYRVYGRLRHQHESLERLFAFTEALPEATDGDATPERLLDGVRDLLRAEAAALVLEGDGPRRVWYAGAVTPEVRSAVLAVHEEVQRERAALVRTAGAPPWDDLVALPIHDGDVRGTILAADRIGDVHTFGQDDVQLLQTAAAQAVGFVRNAELLTRLRHDATHDALTQLPNRSAWEAEASARLAGRHWSATQVDAVVLVDLDGFKDVNDTLGHHHGDQLLVEVGRRLVDAAGGQLVARFGGDEFAVLLAGTDPEAARATAQRIVEAMHEPVAIGEVQVEVQASAGIALAPAHGVDVATLLKRADLALYSSKDSPESAVVFHDSLEDHGPNRLALLADLRRALARGEVTLVAQPKAHLDSGEVVGVEALARWAHPTQGPVSPELFVALAERSGLIRQLTESVLDQALALCRRHYERGRPLSVAVNVSPKALLDVAFPDTVVSLLRAHDVPAHLLTLEITESSVIGDPEGAISRLRLLRGLGVHLSLDDFGTGYSSLSYLKRLPVHEVKIDRSFVQDLLHSTDDETIVRAVVDLGRNMRLQVVAEGVEDLATWHRLGELGCDVVQGYHLARPMPLDRFGEWLNQYDATLPARSRVTPLRPAGDATGHAEPA